MNYRNEDEKRFIEVAEGFAPSLGYIRLIQLLNLRYKEIVTTPLKSAKPRKKDIVLGSQPYNVKEVVK